MSDIVVFGSFVVDLMARSAHIPVPGETIKSSLFRMGAGGKGSNQAVACKLSGGDGSAVPRWAEMLLPRCFTTSMKKSGFLRSMFSFPLRPKPETR